MSEAPPSRDPSAVAPTPTASSPLLEGLSASALLAEALNPTQVGEPRALMEPMAPAEAREPDETVESPPPLSPPAVAEAAPAPSPTAPESTPDIIREPPKPRAGGYSIMQQLGLSASRIVIDPGHGGHDPGTMKSGLREKDIVLDVGQLRLSVSLPARPVSPWQPSHSITASS